ncbi:hypothetical protein B0H66DRAFT_538533 [Apodospora peruviana]|uniref:Uncharacterized protein n=1 Tax=Apodospora peruviana TaxID=516989 RepID=A0AAE0HSR5_9PEZI|nr:hypothetical protein B0H66DRAFT_538533 [Apodospora peruviana]
MPALVVALSMFKVAIQVNEGDSIVIVLAATKKDANEAIAALRSTLIRQLREKIVWHPLILIKPPPPRARHPARKSPGSHRSQPRALALALALAPPPTTQTSASRAVPTTSARR